MFLWAFVFISISLDNSIVGTSLLTEMGTVVLEDTTVYAVETVQ
jgi:hypothetical protein